MKHILRVLPDSEAEEYFMKTYMPICKDNVICRLGLIFGWDYNEYEITDDDQAIGERQGGFGSTTMP